MGQSVAQDTRSKLIEAGKRVIFKKGFHGARVSDITSDAGLAHGTFYIYFKSKEEFLLELLLSVREEILTLIEDGKRAISEGSLEKGKDLVFVKPFELMVREKELAKILFFEAICTDRKFQEFYRESKEILLRETREVLELLRVERAEVKAHILMGTARHLIELLILTGEEVNGKWMEVLRELGVYS